MLEVIETVFLVQHESWECKCGLSESVCNSNQKWNHNRCRCTCKGLNDWVLVKMIICEVLVLWDCECNKACKTNEYLDIESC